MPDQASKSSGPADAALEELLLQLLDASFVLTGPHGAVTRWGPRAEALFGARATEAGGRPLFETLTGGGPVPPEAERWAAVLEGGDGEAPEPRVQMTARHRDGHEFACELCFIPIRLSDGLAFNLFMRDLALDLPPDMGLRRLRHDHEAVLATIADSLGGATAPAGGERLAGAIVAFRPLEAAPWLEAPPPAADAAAAADHLTSAQADRRRTDEAMAEVAAAREEAAGATARLEQLGRENAEIRARLEELAAAAERRAEEPAGAPLHPESLAAEAHEAVREALGELTGEVEGLRDSLSSSRAAIDGALAEAEAARADAQTARAEAEAARRELSDARDRLVAGVASADTNGAPPAPEPPEQPPGRPPREGFDDADAPMAVIGLDGRFSELNPRFSELVGYPERDFHSAMWPSVGDREHFEQHSELKRALLAGEREEAVIETCYMGAAGLLLQIGGRISVVRDDDGSPRHLLFVAA